MALRIRQILLLGFLLVLCASLLGCGGEDPSQPPEYDWTQSEFADKVLAPAGILMEMAYETYGIEDKIFSYILTNTTMSPLIFSGAFNLEHYLDGKWLSVLLGTAADRDETHELPDMQMCRVDVDISQIEALPEGLYRIVIMAGDGFCAAEFKLEAQRIDARQMDFGYLPLQALPAGFDDVDAENEGYYTITERGPVNQESVQGFADKVSLNVPAKLRTVMLSEEGEILVRDTVYEFTQEGNGRFFVTTDRSRISGLESGDPLYIEQVYSFLSVAKVDDKKKLCLSNYVSYSDYAPDGAAMELISPEAPDNIDLVATVELRTEESMLALPYSLMVFGANDASYITIAKNGDSFSVKSGDTVRMNISPGDGATLTGARWLNSTQVSLSGFMADEQEYQAFYDLEKNFLEPVTG